MLNKIIRNTMKVINNIALSITLISLMNSAFAQNTPQGVSIANDQVPPSKNAMLDVVSTEKGMLIPRVTHSTISDPTGALRPSSIIPGEDGLMQAYFELINMPQTSCDYYQAALTFNKRDMLSVLKPYGIKTATSFYLNLGDDINVDAILEKVGLPCFVKPNKSGSSFGISKVKTREEFLPAIENAYKEDDEIIIESFLDGTEVSVGVINYKGTVTVLPITEIVSENDFFDYEAKYLGKSKEITPARISDELKIKIETVAKRAYEVLKMKGFSRSEFIIVNNEPHMLEMNTIPGLTTESILPQQAREAGISLPELFENAIELALKK